MDPPDLTVHVLREVRDEIQETRKDLHDEIVQTRIDLSARIDETNAKVDRLERRQTESEIRVANDLVALAAAVREVRDELRQDRVLRIRVDDHERRIEALEDRAHR